jgi:hypothetical protein
MPGKVMVRPANGSARVGGSVAMARGIQAMLPLSGMIRAQAYRRGHHP